MTFITASSGQGPTDDEFKALQNRVNQIAEVLKPESIAKLVQIAIRPVHAEIALAEKETGIRNGMLVNRRPANDDFSDVDLNAQMDEQL